MQKEGIYKMDTYSQETDIVLWQTDLWVVYLQVFCYLLACKLAAMNSAQKKKKKNTCKQVTKSINEIMIIEFGLQPAFNTTKRRIYWSPYETDLAMDSYSRKEEAFN